MTSMHCLQLLGALGSPQNPLEKAERCLDVHKHTPRKRRWDTGEVHRNLVKPHWATELIQVLCAEEAIIVDDKLTFVSKLSLLPVDVQRNILRFVLRHTAEIQTSNLETLLSTLQRTESTDEWCKFHTLSLLDYLNTKTGKNTSQNLSTQVTSCCQKVSRTKRESFNNICKQLSGETISSSSTSMERCSLKFDWLKFTSQHPEASDVTNQSSAQNIENIEQDLENMETEEDRTERTDEDIDGRGERVQLRLSPPGSGLSTEGVKVLDDISGSGVTPLDMMDREDASPAVNISTVVGVSGADEICNEENQNTDRIKIDQTLKRNLDLLKTEIFACTSGSTLSQTAQETCKQILHSPTEVANELWNFVDIDEVPLPGLECLCQFVIHDLGPTELSYTAAAKMADRCFSKKLQEASSSAIILRTLSATLFSFAKVFPKPTIEGVILPCISKQGHVTSSFDMAAKLCKDIFSNEHRLHLLNALLQSQELVWCDQHTDLLQSLLSSKLELDPNCLSTLVASLEKHGISHQSCKKFAKLLLFIINQYGKQMTSSDVSSMQRLATANKTFLKKAALNSLKKISSS